MIHPLFATRSQLWRAACCLSLLALPAACGQDAASNPTRQACGATHSGGASQHGGGDGGTAELVQRDNEFVNAGAVVARGLAFEPPYSYQHALEPAKQVKDRVTAGAGVR